MAFTLCAGHTYFLLGAELCVPHHTKVRRFSLLATVAVLVISLPLLVIVFFRSGAASAAPINFGVYATACVVAFAGVLVVLRRHRQSWQVWLLLFSAIAGAVDALLPAFAELGLPLWQPDFLGRALDVILWLPGAVVALRWLDAQPPPLAESAAYKGGVTRAGKI